MFIHLYIYLFVFSYQNEMYKPKTAVEPNTMNIQKAWQKGYTGKNITICINDPTGVDYNNAELRRRFVSCKVYIFTKIFYVIHRNSLALLIKSDFSHDTREVCTGCTRRRLTLEKL